jgi:TatD DNase family protein
MILAPARQACPSSHRLRETQALLPDTHAHLDAAAFSQDLDSILQRALEAGISRILAVGSDLATSRRAVELAGSHDIVYAAAGIHPHEAARFSAEADQVRALLSLPKVVAVGEIGLDYVRDGVPRAAQLAAFQEQLSWARAADLPVSVHNRGADRDILAAVSRAGVHTILHCFSGTEAFARQALDAGHNLSFAGNLTFPKAVELRAVACIVPDDRLLVESDAPVLAPQPRRGRRNEPALVMITAHELANARNVSLELLARHVSANADRLFSWGAA